jgi:Ca2+-dependent lipid-binding protein
VREGRSQRSKIVKNSANPVYNEEFFLLVDDYDKQKLSIKVSKAHHGHFAIAVTVLLLLHG